jgi:cell fate regulator YaaT (PSP1 superfamily)
MTSHDWLSGLPDTTHLSPLVEVRFKGTRKEFYNNSEALSLGRNDVVVVASNGGHDIGIVSLTGKMAEMQYNRKITDKSRYPLHTIYRKARTTDLERWEKAKEREKPVMIRSRILAKQLNLEMKVADVEFRGDGAKAIFYYIADGRVDFRELIKVYAREFGIKVEMKQIGARQEAARIGGIGSCGRELCCSSWRSNFTSISTSMALKQGLSPNAEKLAGSCGKLKCCLMYEIDTYLEAQSDFPEELMILETQQGIAHPLKPDILERKVWYTLKDEKNQTLVQLTIDEIKEIIQLNKRGVYPDITKRSESTKLSGDEKNMFNKNLTSDRKPRQKKRLNEQRARKGIPPAAASKMD